MPGPTRSFSARLNTEVMKRLERTSRRMGTGKSKLAERYIDEGIRMDEHPGIVFRDGPTGRRAALPGGPDVWEVMATIRAGKARGEAAVKAAAELLDLPVVEVKAAVGYYAAYPDEIDERLRIHLEEADAAEAAWRKQRAALA